jgi:hypothetical protein
VDRTEFCRPGGLEARVEDLILEAGDRKRAVLALLEHAAPEAPAAAEAEQGSRTVLTVRVTMEEARAIEAAHAARGMSRAEWVRAVLRRQISRQRPLSRVDRGYLSKAAGELRAIRAELARMRAAVAHAAAYGREVDDALAQLGAFERRIVAVADAVHYGFLGEDSYWRELHAED